MQLERTESQEALCRIAIERDNELARAVAVSAGYAPREPLQRAVFYFLTEQWSKYEELDFDQSLLRSVHLAQDSALKKRIAEKARNAGRLEWVEVLAGGRQSRRLRAMSDRDWHAALELLVARKQWREVWSLALEAPSKWGTVLLETLIRHNWAPEGSERPHFDALVRVLEGRMPLVAGSERPPSSLAVSADARLLARGSRDGVIFLGSVNAADAVRRLPGHTSAVLSLAFSADSGLLASGSADKDVRLWSLPEGSPVAVLRGHQHWVVFVAFSLDGRILCSGSEDGTVRVWTAPDWREQVAVRVPAARCFNDRVFQLVNRADLDDIDQVSIITCAA
jgi:hypothetical protein